MSIPLRGEWLIAQEEAHEGAQVIVHGDRFHHPTAPSLTITWRTMLRAMHSKVQAITWAAVGMGMGLVFGEGGVELGVIPSWHAG